MRVLYRWRARPNVPLLVFGRRGAWTIDGVAATFPPTIRRSGHPADGRSEDDLADPRDLGGGRGAPHRGRSRFPFVLRGTTATTRLQLWSKPGAYDEYRGLLRITASSTAPLSSVVNDVPLETYVRGVVPAEMGSTSPRAALEAQTIAARSYAARRLRPACLLLRRRRHGRRPGLSRSEGRDGDHERDRPGDGRGRAAQRFVDRQHPLPLDRRRRDREQRERLHLGDRRKGRGRRQLPPRLERQSARRDGLRCRRSVGHLEDADLHGRPAVGLVRRRRAHRRRDADRSRPSPYGSVGPAHQRDAHRLGWDEEGVRRGLPVRLQRGPAGGRSARCAAPCSESRRSPEPLSSAA